MSTSENITRPADGQLLRRVEEQALEDRVLRKVTLRLIPFLFLLYMLNILDRVNIGFARIQMVPSVISETVFGLGASIFYAGYFLFEVPSNLIMKRTGARVWIGRIMITWGMVSTCMMFVSSAWSFYLLRFLLGLAEAGFFPGIILFVSFWFPARYRARTVSRFMTASAFTGIVGGPLSGAIMYYLNDVGGLTGYQWLFLLEGTPTIIVGFLTLYYLTDYPADAHWLSDEERNWLTEHMQREEKTRERHHAISLLQSFTNPRIMLLCAIYFTVAMGSNSFGNYSPQIINDQFKGFSEFQVGLLTAIPNLCAMVAMNVVGLHSDRTGERRWHVAISALVAAVGWTVVALSDSSFLLVLGLALAHSGQMSMLAPFWSLPTSFLSGVAAAGGIAFINSVGNLGGGVGPIVISYFKESMHSFSYGFLFVAGVLVAGAVLVLLAQGESRHSESKA